MYPKELPLISVASTNPILNRQQSEKFRIYLEDYSKELTTGMELIFGILLQQIIQLNTYNPYVTKLMSD